MIRKLKGAAVDDECDIEFYRKCSGSKLNTGRHDVMFALPNEPDHSSIPVENIVKVLKLKEIFKGKVTFHHTFFSVIPNLRKIVR